MRCVMSNFTVNGVYSYSSANIYSYLGRVPSSSQKLEEAFNEFQGIISKLPEHFRHLADHVQEDDIVVDGSDDLIQEYLSNPPGHYEPDDDKDSDDSPYSPIDAIFQR